MQGMGSPRMCVRTSSLLPSSEDLTHTKNEILRQQFKVVRQKEFGTVLVDRKLSDVTHACIRQCSMVQNTALA